jgi:hypothetical protein
MYFNTSTVAEALSVWYGVKVGGKREKFIVTHIGVEKVIH